MQKLLIFNMFKNNSRLFTPQSVCSYSHVSSLTCQLLPAKDVEVTSMTPPDTHIHRYHTQSITKSCQFYLLNVCQNYFFHLSATTSLIQAPIISPGQWGQQHSLHLPQPHSAPSSSAYCSQSILFEMQTDDIST